MAADDKAFDAFYRAEYGRLAGALALICNDATVGEELAQEAFVRSYAAWSRVAVLERPVGWVYVTGFNLARRRWRSLRRSSPSPASTAGPVETADDRLDLARALSRLPFDQRRAVVARHVLGFSTVEAAELLGRSPDALRQLLHRGIAALRLQPALSTEGE